MGRLGGVEDAIQEVKLSTAVGVRSNSCKESSTVGRSMAQYLSSNKAWNPAAARPSTSAAVPI
jgi:hypothetical protein